VVLNGKIKVHVVKALTPVEAEEALALLADVVIIALGDQSGGKEDESALESGSLCPGEHSRASDELLRADSVPEEDMS